MVVSFRANIFIFVVFATPLFGAQEKTVMAQKLAPMRDLMIFADANETMITSGVSAAFNIAMCQQAAPLVVTIHTLMLIDLSAIVFNKCDIHRIFMSDSMRIYDKADFFLIIPRSYKQRFLDMHGEQSFSEEQILHAMGFITKNLKNFSLHDLKDSVDIYRKRHENGERIALPVEVLRRIVDTASQGSFLWNIYLCGHGLYPAIRRTTDPSSEYPCEVPFFASKSSNTLFDFSKYDARIAGFALPQMQDLLRFFNEVATNFLYVLTCYSGGVNSTLLYNALLLKPLSQQQQPGQPKKRDFIYSRPIPPAFTIVSESSFDSPAYAFIFEPELCALSSDNTQSGAINFNAFFHLLARYRNENIKKYGLADSQTPTRYSDEELRTIIKQVNILLVNNQDDPANLINLPQILFPHASTFTFFPIDPVNMKIISETNIQAVQRTNSPLVIRAREVVKKNNVMDKEESAVEPTYVFLSAAQIPVPIQVIGTGIPRFVSLLPGIALHSIDSIDARGNTAGTLNNFLRAFPVIEAKYPKYFYIERVYLRKNENDPATFSAGADVQLENVLLVLRDKILSVFFVDTRSKRIYFVTAAYLKKQQRLNIVFSPIAEEYFQDPALSPLANVVNFLSTSKTFAPKVSTLYKELVALEEIRIGANANESRTIKNTEEKYRNINQLRIDVERLSAVREEEKAILEQTILKNIQQIGNLQGSPYKFVLEDQFNLLAQALRAHSLPIYKQLIEITGIPLRLKAAADGSTLLMNAIDNGDQEIIKYLLDRADVNVNEADNVARTALQRAAALYVYEQRPMVKGIYGAVLEPLLKKGADPKQIQAYTNKESAQYNQDIAEKVEMHEKSKK